MSKSIAAVFLVVVSVIGDAGPEGDPADLAALRALDQAYVDGNLGVVYGRSSLRFEYAGKQTAQQGNFMLVGRKGEDGTWRVSRMIWNNRTVD